MTQRMLAESLYRNWGRGCSIALVLAGFSRLEINIAADERMEERKSCKRTRDTNRTQLQPQRISDRLYMLSLLKGFFFFFAIIYCPKYSPLCRSCVPYICSASMYRSFTSSYNPIHKIDSFFLTFETTFLEI
jgi:hypothetical protein